MIKHKFKKIEIFNGASIMVKHNSEALEDDKASIPYLNATKGSQKNSLQHYQNRIAAFNFIRSERDKGESGIEHYNRDKKFFDEMLKQICKKFTDEGLDIYTLNSITKTSRKILLN